MKKKKKRQKEIEKKVEKSRFISYHVCGNYACGNQNFHLRRYASARIVVGCSRHASITMLRVFR